MRIFLRSRTGRYLTGIQFSGYESLGFNIPKIIKYGAAEVRYAVLTVVDSLKELVKGRISADDIAGPVRIVSIIDDTVDQVRPYGLVTVFMNILNLMVVFRQSGTMKLLPFPALDGGVWSPRLRAGRRKSRWTRGSRAR